MSARLTEALLQTCTDIHCKVAAKLISTVYDETDCCTVVRFRLQSSSDLDAITCDVDTEHYDIAVCRLRKNFPLLQSQSMRSLLDSRHEIEVRIHKKRRLWKLSYHRVTRGLLDRVISSFTVTCIVAAFTVVAQHLYGTTA